MDVFTTISLCTGYDGIGLGLRRAIPNMRTVAYVERECYPICNLVAKIQAKLLDDAPIWDDVATFDGKPFAGLVDLIHAGVPCQPWSVAGKRKGTKDERWIWGDIFRVIVEVQPEYVFLEEVPGFVSGGGLGFVLSDLAQAGFDAEWGCYTAAECGAPHRRQRLFILAHHKSERDLPVQQQEDSAIRTAGELADRTSPRLSGPEGQHGSGPSLLPARFGEHGELANAETTERRGGSEKYAGRRIEKTGRYDGMWPARPGQPQYEWEEPRVVGDAGKSRTNPRTSQGGSRNSTGESGEGKTQPGVGLQFDRDSGLLDENY